MQCQNGARSFRISPSRSLNRRAETALATARATRTKRIRSENGAAGCPEGATAREVHFTFSSMRDFRKNPVPQAHVRAAGLSAGRPIGRKTESKLAYASACIRLRVHIDARHHARVDVVHAGATRENGRGGRNWI